LAVAGKGIGKDYADGIALPLRKIHSSNWHDRHDRRMGLRGRKQGKRERRYERPPEFHEAILSSSADYIVPT
jgi:hypothetical protein